MKKEYLYRNVEFSSTKAFEIKSYNIACERNIDWASQTLIENQTRAISSNNHQKKANITIHKNVKGW